MPIRRVTNVIMETTVLVDLTEFDFANRKAQSVANIIGVPHTGIRTPAHEDSHEFSGKRPVGEPNQFIISGSFLNVPMHEWRPVVIIIGMQMHWILALPVLNFVPLRVGASPVTPNSVDPFAR